MLRMLNPDPLLRASAAELMYDPFFNINVDDPKMSDHDYKIYLFNKKTKVEEEPPYLDKMRGLSPYPNGDVEDNQERSEDSADDDEFYGKKPGVDIKIIDRSFTNMGYIGFGDGIDLDALDNGGNW